MKKALSVILAGVILSSMAASVSAYYDCESKGNVPKVPAGQITLDGDFTESVWADALQVTIDTWTGEEDSDAYAIAYMLWTDGAWYVYYDVYDSDVVVPSDETKAEHPWTSDSVEMFFDFGNEHADLVQQFRIDNTGYPSYYTEGGETSAYGEAADPYFDDFAVKADKDGYNVEMMINLDKYGLKEGDAIGIQLQLNDCLSDNPDSTYSIHNMQSSNDAGSWDAELYDYIVLGAELEVEAPVEDPVDGSAGEVVDAPVDAAPETADAGIVAAAAVMAIAAGVVLSKKH